jgi:hypothetical protein
MSEVVDISRTIIPKSDQLNADQLLGGPLTITVTHVTANGGEDQPVAVHYEGENGRPYKPCKTMRKLLVYAWGADAGQWGGRSMTLFNEPDVKFGGETVGGIRISHLSDIQGDIKVSLTTTRGKKAQTSVKKMARAAAVDHAGLIRAAASVDELKEAFAAAYRSTKDVKARGEFKGAYDERMSHLTRDVKAGDALPAEPDFGDNSMPGGK